MRKVPDIEKRWIEAGSPPCHHGRTDKEYDLGAQTGDIVCLDCGETWWSGGPVPPPRGGGS